MSSKHSFDEYMKWAKSFLQIEAPIVLYTTQDMVEPIRQMRGSRPIHIVVAPFEDTYMWKTYKEKWPEEIKRDTNKSRGVNHTPELYALWSNKWIWMEDAIKMDPFKTANFLWCDFGAFRNGKESDTVYKNFPLSSRFQPGKIIALMLKGYSEGELAKFRANFKDYTTESVIGGGIWGGDKAACVHFRKSYEAMLNRFFEGGKWAGQDQRIMSAVFLDEPSLGLLIRPHALDIPGYDEWFFLKYYLSDPAIQSGGGGHCLFATLGGGLGNHLYMYAAAATVAKKLNLPVCLLPSENKHSARPYRDILDAEPVEPTSEILARIDAAPLAIPKPEKFYSKLPEPTSDTQSKDKKMPEGYFQNYPSIQGVIPEIKSMLVKKEFYKEQYTKYEASIPKAEDAAFLHVRRGDYAKEGWLNQDDYYMKALERMGTNVKTIYVLSDDIAWCKTQEPKWKGVSKAQIVCKDIPDELEALYFMTLCRGGAILSTSTFSSWGAYLGANENPDSVILYPKYNPITKSSENVYEFPERWIAL